MLTDQLLPFYQHNVNPLEAPLKAIAAHAPTLPPFGIARQWSAFSRRAWLGVALFLALLVGARFWADLHGYERDTQWVEQTRELLHTTHELLANLRDAETGQRGYLLTGQEFYLSPYQSAVASLPSLQHTLRQLTADNPGQQKRFAELDRLIEQKLAELATTIRLRRSDNLVAALAIVRTHAGQQLMDQIRLAVEAVNQERYHSLAAHQQQARLEARTAHFLTFSVVLLLFLISTGAVALIEHDILQRQRLESSLRTSESRLALAFQASRSGTFDWDARNNVNLWSKELLELYGFLPGQSVPTSQDWVSCLHSEDRSAGLAAIQRSFQTGEFDLEFRIRRQDNGEVRWMHGRGQVYFDEHGKPARMIGINVDLTERKQAEEALRANDERLALAQAAAQVGSWDWDTVTDQAICSKEYGPLYGRPARTGPVPFREWLDVIHPEDRKRAAEEVRRALWEDAPFDTEYRVVWPDDSVHWLVGKARVFRNAAGQPIRMIGVNYDVTERKRTAEALASQTERLQEANRELEQFAYIVSHDLQEPLRTITNYAQLLNRRYKGTLDEEADQFLRFIREGASRMQALITGLLHYARAVEPSQTAGKTSLSLEESLRQALQDLQASIDQSAAIVTHDPLPTVVGPLPPMTQVFQNLIGNALKYRKDDEPAKVHISAQRAPGEWILSVRDHGIGFEPREAKHIFGIFQRLHKAEYEGTGVGLAICKRVVEQAGGRIWAEGRPGNGAVFYVALPADP